MLEDLVGDYHRHGEVIDWIHLKHDMLPAHGTVAASADAIAEASAHVAINTALTRSRGNASEPVLRGPEDSAKP